MPSNDKHALLLLLLLPAVLLLCGSPVSVPKAAAAGNTVRYISDYRGDPDAAVDAVAASGGTLVAIYSQIGILVAESGNPGFAAALGARPNFNYVEEDQIVQWVPPSGVEVSDFTLDNVGDPVTAGPPGSAAFLSRQWNLFTTQTNLAWNVTLGSVDVKVAILDTGICTHHPEMAGKLDAAQSASFVPAANECPDTVAPACAPGACPAWEDRNFHGTHVASIVSSNNLGTASIAPNVRLRAVKVLNCQGSGAFSWVIAGIIYATNSGNDVINMSLGASGTKEGAGHLIDALNKAVNYAETQGVLVVSAAGNEGIDLDHSGNITSIPCQSGSGLCVAATTRNDSLATFSNHGVSAALISAPGGGNPVAPFPAENDNRFILGPCGRHSTVVPVCGTSNFYVFVQGTGQATAHVSGAAALVDSVSPGGPGFRRASQLRDALLQNVDDLGPYGTDNIYGRGRLNVFRAVQ